MEIEIKDILKQKIGKEVILKGWIRFNRVSKKIGFINVFDGSFLNGIQVVYKFEENENIYNELSKIPLWSGIKLKGKILQTKDNKEVLVKEILKIWPSNEKHPLGKKQHSLEFLREQAHLRPKTKLFQSIMKIRSVAAQAIHEFFALNDFILVHTPIITSNDAEGAGETFKLGNNKNGLWNEGGFLTVSGQLHAEGYAQAFGKVYTFGPTFRAENSNTKRHAAEFWMVEPEVAFADYNEMMILGEAQVKFVIDKVLKLCNDELDFLDSYYEKHLKKTLKKVSTTSFKKITYENAIKYLQDAIKKGKKFKQKNIKFGLDLVIEHEKYLTDELFKCPVYIYDFPSSIKSFYMYKNDDKTSRGFDLLVPGIGELIGGSQRLEDYNELMLALKQKKLENFGLDWYVNLRKEGYVMSSGYGLGFERLVMFLTGTENIRDVIPFPRTPGMLEF